jgi:hypothetical protein
MVEVQLGIMPLMLGYKSIQKTTRENVGDFALPPISADTPCSVAGVGLIKRRYRDVSNLWDASRDVEGDSSSKGPSDQASSLVRATGCASTLCDQH